MGQVNVELGNHILDSLDNDGIYKKLESGDMSGSAWPTAVSDRLVRHDPDFVVMDGLAYDDGWDYTHEDMQDPDVRDWVRRASTRRRAYMPPNLPEILDKEIIMVGGDATGLSEFVLANGGSESLNSLFKFAAFSGLFLSTGTVLELMRYYNHRIAFKAHTGANSSVDPLIKANEDTDPPSFTRRRFIGKALVAGAGATLLTVAGPGMAADLGSDRADFFYRFAQYTDQIGFNNAFRRWVDGRTALMLQKAFEISEEQDASVSVLMGSAHYRNLDQYLELPEARLKAIEDLTVLLADIFRDASDAYTGMGLAERMEHLRSLIGKYSLIGVKPNIADQVFPIDVATSDTCINIAERHVDLPLVVDKPYL